MPLEDLMTKSSSSHPKSTGSPSPPSKSLKKCRVWKLRRCLFGQSTEKVTALLMPTRTLARIFQAAIQLPQTICSFKWPLLLSVTPSLTLPLEICLPAVNNSAKVFVLRSVKLWKEWAFGLRLSKSPMSQSPLLLSLRTCRQTSVKTWREMPKCTVWKSSKILTLLSQRKSWN